MIYFSIAITEPPSVMGLYPGGNGLCMGCNGLYTGGNGLCMGCNGVCSGDVYMT